MSKPENLLGPARILGYGIGDVGFNLFYTGLNLYLLYYYTDILFISPHVGGLIFMLAVIWDAITDPIMGWIVTRTRTRFGRFRPYLLIASPILALSFVAMFAAPLMFPSAIVLAAAISHLVFRTMYTVVSIPFSALSAVITRDARARSSIAGVRVAMGFIAGLLAAYVTLDLANYFGEGDLAAGFVVVACIYSAVFTALMLVVFFSTSEGLSDHESLARPDTRATIRFLARNTAAWVLFIGIFGGAIASSISAKAVVYYVSYNLGEPDSISVVLTAYLTAAAISTPIWAWLARQISKKSVWIIAMVGWSTSLLLLLIIAPDSVRTLLLLEVFAGVFYGGFGLVLWAMLPDTVEYGEWRSGIRDEGMVYGLTSFAMKAASGLAVGGLGVGLSLVGYEAGTTLDSDTLQGIRVLAFGVPIFGILLGTIAILFYPIDHALHERLRRAISYRSAKKYQRREVEG